MIVSSWNVNSVRARIENIKIMYSDKKVIMVLQLFQKKNFQILRMIFLKIS